MRIENVPVKSTLKIEKGFDPFHGMDEYEAEAYGDWMHWHMSREHELLRQIPNSKGVDFWMDGDEWQVSAFNTADFRRHNPKPRFNYEHWKMREILKRVDDLALMHSCISTKQERVNVHERYMSLLEREFLCWQRAAISAGNTRKAVAIEKKIVRCNRVWFKWNPRDSD